MPNVSISCLLRLATWIIVYPCVGWILPLLIFEYIHSATSARLY